MKESIAEKLFDNMRLYFPIIAERVVKYREDSQDLLITEMEDGNVFLYDDIDNSIRRIDYDSESMTEANCRHEFGKRLRRLMLRSGITQEDLSERTGISQASISTYMTGRNTPSFYNVVKIANVLNCSIDDLRFKK